MSAEEDCPSGSQAHYSSKMSRSVAPFVRKTYDLVSDNKFSCVVSWSESGDSFIIHQPHVFQQEVLPCYFKHNNLCSFIRQLNTYGFKKQVKSDEKEKLEFHHKYFKIDQLNLLQHVIRRKPTFSSKNAAQVSNCTIPSCFDVKEFVDQRQPETPTMVDSPTMAAESPIPQQNPSVVALPVHGYSTPTQLLTPSPVPIPIAADIVDSSNADQEYYQCQIFAKAIIAMQHKQMETEQQLLYVREELRKTISFLNESVGDYTTLNSSMQFKDELADQKESINVEQYHFPPLPFVDDEDANELGMSSKDIQDFLTETNVSDTLAEL